MNKDFIINTEKSDLSFIYHLFDEAIAYKKKSGYPVWREYEEKVLMKEIENKLQYKFVINEEIIYIFSVCYSDKIIWREKDKDDAVYLHRMVVNPKFKGQKLFGKVLEWTKRTL